MEERDMCSLAAQVESHASLAAGADFYALPVPAADVSAAAQQVNAHNDLGLLRLDHSHKEHLNYDFPTETQVYRPMHDASVGLGAIAWAGARSKVAVGRRGDIQPHCCC